MQSSITIIPNYNEFVHRGVADVNDTIVVSGNGTAHHAVQEQFSNYSEVDGSVEIIARIPNYNCEIKENGSVNNSFGEQVEESNDLDAFKELQVKDTNDSLAQPKCETDISNSLGHKNDTKNKIYGNNAKKTTSLKSEKKSVNSKPTIVQAKARLTKEKPKYFLRMFIS